MKNVRVRTFNCPDEHDFALQRLCVAEHRDLSNMIRECIRREAVRQGFWREQREEKENG